MSAKNQDKVDRQTVHPADFGREPVLADPSKIQPVAAPKPLTTKHKVYPMFSIKSKVIKWAIGALATIPEEYIWDFIQSILAKLQRRFDGRPGLRKVFEVFSAVLTAVEASSDGGRYITKGEVKKILEKIW